ncbi:dTDP-4-dehydrorhamnose 3,5-epimerase [uncultured Campylobacter sp.]|uniref:dTDP-4-dehydrorhamnose 3,5-epimerase family protein n=1 Tax=uncultured Campylobacter sp. TaxID=218934 RepID=UPI002611E2EC|nr:dTDP-4-dehydrorhamnose 3,5-epimerase [uncultured Campylobacter sp.]
MSIDFRVEKSNVLDGVYIIHINKFSDLRGEIYSVFLSDEIDCLLPNDLKFKHDKVIHSKKNVIRGIHGDTKTFKLCTCLKGKIQQVVVDLNKDSKTYKKHQSFIMSDENRFCVLVPAGFGNSHAVLSDEAIYYYKCAYEGDYVDAHEQFTVAYNDKSLGIDWLVKEPILSNRDKEIICKN